ncbi:Chaperone protein dnaj 20 protein [Thalictrum thalictroides]|uniref:Chaperone protein dnaj 20 protein n=1 Tax=Thalictrum thalictroides TaxID=46969 RepID=A0A7J6XDC4_THATH|nr:Chaperone protein dnaj 20 protein [Thalictrum thalictroides]
MITKCSGCNIFATQKKKGTNLYKVLSLGSQNVGFDDIKKAYRSMARQYHPDVVPASRKEESTRRFVQLHKAYETLSDPILRQKYDYQLGTDDVLLHNEEQRNYCSNETWEYQLQGLKQRSQVRMKSNKRTHI